MSTCYNTLFFLVTQRRIDGQCFSGMPMLSHSRDFFVNLTNTCLISIMKMVDFYHCTVPYLPLGSSARLSYFKTKS